MVTVMTFPQPEQRGFLSCSAADTGRLYPQVQVPMKSRAPGLLLGGLVMATGTVCLVCGSRPQATVTVPPQPRQAFGMPKDRASKVNLTPQVHATVYCARFGG